MIVDPPGGNYLQGTEVTLIAVPISGSNFISWSNDLTGSTNPVTITIDSNKDITAIFGVAYNLFTAVVGNGSIELDPAGGGYAENTTVLSLIHI